jgi:hypothetical protein
MAQRGKPRPLVFSMTLVVLLYALASGAIALANADQCGGGARYWQVAPPQWVCR